MHSLARIYRLWWLEAGRDHLAFHALWAAPAIVAPYVHEQARGAVVALQIQIDAIALERGGSEAHLGAERVHLCQIRPLEHGRYSIFAKASVDYTGGRDKLLAAPKELKRLIGSALRQKKFKGKRVVALIIS